MKVSVVVPAYNEEKYIGPCLQALMDQVEKPDEIILINNNSTDKTVEIAKKFPGVEIITEKKQGMIPARNRGFDTARYEIIARTDADTIVPPDWIKKIKEKFLADKDMLALSGPAHFYGIPDIIQKNNWPSQWNFKFFKQLRKHNFLFGPNMSLTKSAWEMVKNEVCLNDKDVHEDMDLAIHLAQHGKIVFAPDLIVNSSSRRIGKLVSYFEYPYRHVKTFQKHKNLKLPKKEKKLSKQTEEIIKRLTELSFLLKQS